jgi:hypothetical protein
MEGQQYLAHFDAFDMTTVPGRECALTGACATARQRPCARAPTTSPRPTSHPHWQGASGWPRF